MQCATDLIKLRDSIISRVRFLRRLVSAIRSPAEPGDKRVLAFATIELDNLIIIGLRQYTKSSLLRSRTAAGIRITATVQPNSTEEAAAFIYKSLNPSGYLKLNNPPVILESKEIVFRDPKQAEKVFIDYSASNLTNLILALSLNAQAFSEVKICRHFFAHRAKNTCLAVQTLAASLGIVGRETPEALIVCGRPSTGVRLLDGWLSDVENFFDLAT